MLVKVSNKMRKFLADNIPEYNFTLEKMSLNEYRIKVDFEPIYHTDDLRDSDGKMQAIKVIYPADFYAMDRYLTTRDLVKLFRNTDSTAAEFIQAVKDEIAI